MLLISENEWLAHHSGVRGASVGAGPHIYDDIDKQLIALLQTKTGVQGKIIYERKS